jgi:PKD repeat protein
MVTFTNTSQDADEYLWAFGDGSFDTLQNPVHLYQISGTYDVQLVAVNACSADTLVQQVTVTVTGVQDVSVFRDVRVYPNPNTGAFTLSVDGPEDGFQIEVYDLLGNLVRHEILNPGKQGTYDLQMTDVPPGVFTLLLRKAESTFVTKVVVLE